MKTKVASFEKTQSTERINVNADAAYIRCLIFLFFDGIRFDENISHPGKNIQHDRKPIAQNIRREASWTVIVIKP